MPLTRPLRTADAPAVLALETALAAADRTGEHDDLDDVAHGLADPGLDLAADTLGIFDSDDLLAQGRVWVRGAGPGGAELVLTGGVAPAARRHGHGSALLAWARREAVARGATPVSASVPDQAADAADLFDPAG